MRRAFLIALALLLVGSRANATTITYAYAASLSGPAEAPPNMSPGTGIVHVQIVAETDVSNNLVSALMMVDAGFSGLVGNVTASHIHCCTTVPFVGTAGVATPVPTFPGFPGGVKFGTYSHTFDLFLASSFNPSFVTAQGGLDNARTAFLNGLASGKTYWNIHTNVVPSGEIRGFLEPVPEPSAVLLLATGIAACLVGRWRGWRRA